MAHTFFTPWDGKRSGTALARIMAKFIKLMTIITPRALDATDFLESLYG